MNREKLIRAGIDYDQGVNRFAGKAQLYEKYLVKMFDNDILSVLCTQLEGKDYTGAFRSAHDLKGTSGNLSINEFYHTICEIVEQLRGGNPDEKTVRIQLDKAKSLYNAAKEAVLEQV